MPQPTGPLATYRQWLAENKIYPDPAQALAAEKFQQLSQQLAHYQPDLSSHSSAKLSRFSASSLLGFGFLGGKKSDQSAHIDTAPAGLYLYGDVGRGKSMLMDLFMESSAISAKKRVHFHEFMRDVHQTLFKLREAEKQKKGKQQRVPQSLASQGQDPFIPTLARQIADEAWLLCFDEFHVTNIADAMILGRLFEELFRLGVVIVATSNCAPDGLYKDGLQRDRFLPFIALFKQNMDVLHLESPTDYRTTGIKGKKVYFHPLTPATDAEFQDLFFSLSLGEPGKSEIIYINERPVTCQRRCDGLGIFTFQDLCQGAYWAAEYLDLAKQFHTIMIDNIPQLSAANHNEAQRFTTLIDAFYEARHRVVCRATAPAQSLYNQGTGAFEFERTVSRLLEMQSEDYWHASDR